MLLLAAAPCAGFAQCGTQTIPGYETPSARGFDSVAVQENNFPASLAGTAQSGAALWNQWSCNTGGNEFPYFAPLYPQFTVMVNWNNGFRSDGACGTFNTSTREITIYSQRMYNGQLVPCDGHNPEAIAEVIAHELGHFLGLDNTPDFCSANMMMSAQYYNYTTGQFTHKAPSETECNTVNMINNTFSEQNPPPPDPYCEAYGCSPILIDIDGNGFHLTGLENPVAFDINADGQLDLSAWTKPGEKDAFLTLDLNRNGVVDDGGELFGDHTVLPGGSRAGNGYVALALYDSIFEGGNENGFIDPEDSIFDDLKLWIDDNHDGRSEASELFTLQQTGVERIGLHYHQSRREDASGNSFRFLGKAWVSRRHGATEPVRTTDVFFKVR
jgi:hypothetical protein